MKKIKFNTKTLLAITFLFAITLAYYVNWKMNGSDYLVAELRNANAEISLFENRDPSLFAEISGNATANVEKLVFQGSLDPSVCHLLNSSDAARSIRMLKVEGVTIEPTSPFFLDNLDSLEQLELIDVVIPSNWKESLSKITWLKRVVVAGALSNIDANELVSGCDALEWLILSNRSTHRDEIKHFQSQLPNAKVFVTGLYGSVPGEFCGVLDTEESLNDCLRCFYEKIATHGDTARNQLKSGASKKEILELQERLHLPLHPSIVTLLENQNGEGKGMSLLPGFKFLGTDEIAGYVEIESERYVPDQFIEESSSELDGYINFNYVPILASHDIIAIHTITGCVVLIPDDFEPKVLASSLDEFINALRLEIESGSFEKSSAGKIRLRRYPSEISFAQ